MISSKRLLIIAWSFGILGLLMAIVSGIVYSGFFMLSILLIVFLATLFFVFCASVLYHLEILTQEQRITESIGYDDLGRVPLIPKVNIDARSDFINAIKQKGFNSTNKIKAGQYLIAIDANHKEWVVVPPDGKNAKIYSYGEFDRCEIYEDRLGKEIHGIEVKVFIKNVETPIHVILFDKNSEIIKPYEKYMEEAEKICLLLNSIKLQNIN